MSIFTYSSHAGTALLTMLAWTSWSGPGQAQEMEALSGVWGARVGDVEIRMCAQSDPDHLFNRDFAAIYTTQDYQIVLLDRESSTTWSPRLARIVSTTGLDDGSLQLERAPADLWSGVTLVPMETVEDTEPCLTHVFNGPRTFLLEPVVTATELDGVPYEVVSILDPSGHGGVTTFQLPGKSPGPAAINAWLADVLPTTVEEAPYYSCTMHALQFGAGSFWEHRLVPELITDQILVVQETMDVFCGGARPSYSIEWTVFDRETGEEIDTSTWIREDAFYDLGHYAGQGPEIGDPEVARGFRELMVEAFTATNPSQFCHDLLDIVETWDVRPSRDGLVLTPSDDLGPGRACATGLSFSIQEITPYLMDAAMIARLMKRE
ncbi:hypothetical protein [Marivita sp. XM-24bin2]|uniref:hypothetical protein n=1 Tax=Marivita sp. XM-24bin2 TaxID=2133951 RepID=UPI000D7ABEC2|nr:hypothetical protein [Marivita sp. XM-24bin2]PWL33570.1 MAG: hypothetical protein DCO97_18920 [Marivita sp. XM-24bin2]